MFISQVEVEELAALIKDNLYCKHLVLSTEEALGRFLQNDSSSEEVLVFQPMSPYQRLLLHRLADIYGFTHESVGEGEERHLVLERCLETAIPPILVSDILGESVECQAPTTTLFFLRRKNAPVDVYNAEKSVDKVVPSSTLLEVREAAYIAARERIFSLHKTNDRETLLPKSRTVPVVAQRMIAHALGQKVSSLHVSERNYKSEHSALCTSKAAEETLDVFKINSQKKGGKSTAKDNIYKCSSEPERNRNNKVVTQRKAVISTECLEKERIGAAKRIFAQALGTVASSRSQEISVRSNEDKNCS